MPPAVRQAVRAAPICRRSPKMPIRSAKQTIRGAAAPPEWQHAAAPKEASEPCRPCVPQEKRRFSPWLALRPQQTKPPRILPKKPMTAAFHAFFRGRACSSTAVGLPTWHTKRRRQPPATQPLRQSKASGQRKMTRQPRSGLPSARFDTPDRPLPSKQRRQSDHRQCSTQLFANHDTG